MMTVTTDRPTTSMGSLAGWMTTSASPSVLPAAGNLQMVPQCTMKLEKLADGMKITCTCDDEVSCATLQHLCKMLCSGLCSVVCMKNGCCICQCNMAMCNCCCEIIENGVCITCTSGDKTCCDMVQACCDCIAACMKAGCTCCVCFNGTPVCCC